VSRQICDGRRSWDIQTLAHSEDHHAGWFRFTISSRHGLLGLAPWGKKIRSTSRAPASRSNWCIGTSNANAIFRASTPRSSQLCHDRGYLVTQDELDQTIEQFKTQFGDKPRYVHNVILHLLYGRMAKVELLSLVQSSVYNALGILSDCLPYRSASFHNFCEFSSETILFSVNGSLLAAIWFCWLRTTMTRLVSIRYPLLMFSSLWRLRVFQSEASQIRSTTSRRCRARDWTAHDKRVNRKCREITSCAIDNHEAHSVP
jgi:hypothetical protein